jgi:uncharacterized damage-inducible protein DinB
MGVGEVQQLYAYNRWANARIVSAVAALSAEQRHRDLASSHRSVYGTLAHILWGEWLWLGRWQGTAPPGPSPLACDDLPALRVRWGEVEHEQLAFLAQLIDSELERRVTYENPPGVAWTYALRHMLQHVVNHSTYHRGQVVVLLRQLGASTVATDLLVFFDETVSGATVPPGA